jgi:hypothetical protein
MGLMPDGQREAVATFSLAVPSVMKGIGNLRGDIAGEGRDSALR